jgi:hypothetical protein
VNGISGTSEQMKREHVSSITLTSASTDRPIQLVTLHGKETPWNLIHERGKIILKKEDTPDSCEFGEPEFHAKIRLSGWGSKTLLHAEFPKYKTCFLRPSDVPTVKQWLGPLLPKHRDAQIKTREWFPLALPVAIGFAIGCVGWKGGFLESVVYSSLSGGVMLLLALSRLPALRHNLLLFNAIANGLVTVGIAYNIIAPDAAYRPVWILGAVFMFIWTRGEYILYKSFRIPPTTEP